MHSLLLHGPACLLRATKVLLEQTSPWCCTASQEDHNRGAGGLAEPKEPRREAPPPHTCCPPLPLTSLTCSVLLAKIPPGCPWGLLILPGDRKGGGEIQDTPPQNCHWHFCSLQAPKGCELAGTPQNILVGLKELELNWARAGGGGQGIQCRGWVTAGEANPGDGVGVPGLEGVAGRCCQARGHPPAAQRGRVKTPPL